MPLNYLHYLAGLAALSVLPVSCAKETLHAVVVVSTTGIDADVSALQATTTLGGVRATEVQSFLPTQSVFSLQLPDGTTGEVRIDMTATNESGCTLTSGHGLLQVSGPGRYDLTVPLVRRLAPDCQTTVVLKLNGAGSSVSRLAITATVNGTALLQKLSYPGTTRELTLPLGESVPSTVQVSVDGFGCRSCLLRQGTAMLPLHTYGRHDLNVELSPLSQPQCPPLSGRLLQSRYAHSAVLLESGPYAGQVLILAGDRNPPLKSVERYDPRTGAINAAGALLVDRYGHTATLLTHGADRGRILVTGGYNGQWLSEVEIYDPGTGLARTAASLSLPRFGHTATPLADGRVVVIGGHSDQGAYREVEIYDPLTGQWTPADAAPFTEYQHTATLLADGRILVAGGLLQSSATVASAAVFDPSARPGAQWVTAGSLASARNAHSASLLPNGQVLIAGGYGSLNQNLASAELFDPSTLLWRPAGMLAKPRTNHGAVMLSNGRLFMSGGANYYLDQFTASGELYDWTNGGNLPFIPLSLGRAIHTATLLPDDGVLLVAGLAIPDGGGTTTTTDSIELVFPLACSL